MISTLAVNFYRRTMSPRASVFFAVFLFLFDETFSSTNVGAKLKITTIIAEPFMFELVGLDNRTKKVGLVKDILDELSREMNFTYDLYLVSDAIYGAKDENGVWQGLVGEIVYGRADLAAADLTINSPRSEIIGRDWKILIK